MAGPVPANHADPMVRRSRPWPAHAFSSRSSGPPAWMAGTRPARTAFRNPRGLF